MLKIDKLQLDLVINGDNSRVELSRLRTDAAELRKEMKGIKDQKLLGTKKAELNELENKMEKIIHEIDLAKNSCEHHIYFVNLSYENYNCEYSRQTGT